MKQNIKITKVCIGCGKKYNANINNGIYSNSKNRVNRRLYCSQECRQKQMKKTSMKGTSIYQTWQNMKNRCRRISGKDYKNYGGRGITYDESWEKFENFYADIGKEHKKGLSIERIDVNGNYNKKNCTWIPKNKQSENRRVNIFIDFDGEKYSLKELSKKYKIKYITLYNRIFKLKIPIKRALSNIKISQNETHK